MPPRVVDIHRADSHQLLAAGAKLGDRIGESDRGSPLLLGTALTSGIDRHQRRCELAFFVDPESGAGQHRLSAGSKRLAIAVKKASKIVAVHIVYHRIRQA